MNKRKLMKFCKLFGNDLCITENTVLQTFTDNKKIRDKLKALGTKDPLTRLIKGSIKDNIKKLVNLNNKGAGVFFTVNEVLGGRKLENVTKIRAIWCELDEGTIPKFPIKPSIVVESSQSKFHFYFLVDSTTSLADDVTIISQFNTIQARMVETYGSDPSAKDMTRVLRLPGFEHKKGNPFEVSISGGSGIKYSWEEIKTAFPPVEETTSIDMFGEGDGFDPEKTKVNGNGFEGYLTEVAIINTILNGDAYIDPDDGYEQWLKVGIILYNLSTGGEEGLDMWIEWSKASEDFNEKECRSKWKSFTGKRDRSAGMGSLLWLAQQGGYRIGHIDIDILGMEDLIKQEYLRKIAYIEKIMVASVHDGNQKFIRKVYDPEHNRLTYQTLSVPAMKSVLQGFQDAPYIVYDDGVPELKHLPLSTYMLKSKTLSMCNNMYMKPLPKVIADHNDMSVKVDKWGGLNTYTGVEFQPPVAGAKCEWLNFVFEQVLCGGVEEHIEYMKNWFAYTLQKPHKKAIVMPIFQGREGIGKGLIIEMFARAFGRHSTTITSEHQLGGHFNTMIADSCFVYLNELYIGDPKVLDMVKAMVSDEAMRKEAKGVDAKMVKNYANFVLSTNNEKVLITDKESRRWFFLVVDDSILDDKELYWKVFKACDKEKRSGGEQAFISQFLERKIEGFDPKLFPKSNSITRLDNLTRGGGSMHHYMYELIKNDCVPLDLDYDAPIYKELDEGVIRVAAGNDYNSYVAFSDRHRRRPVSKHKFGMYKSSLGVGNNHKIRDNGKQHLASDYPKPKVIKKSFSKELGIPEEQIADYFETGILNVKEQKISFKQRNFMKLKKLKTIMRTIISNDYLHKVKEEEAKEEEANFSLTICDYK